MKNTDLELIY